MSRYFISIDGKCKECGYPVICDAGDVLDKIPNIYGKISNYDFHLYCANPDCKNHIGVSCFDTEIDKEYVPFLEVIK